jgi:hypothetical protein
MIYQTECDMGSIKIFNEELSMFFSNNIGDGTNAVHIVSKEKAEKLVKKVGKTINETFLGHFTVKKGRAHLGTYDCDDIPIASFGKGRWWVLLIDIDTFVIYKQDNDLHA